jgi:DNA-binding CsgD family transcriptional regulator
MHDYIEYPSKDFLGRVAENRACPGVFIFDDAIKVVWADRRGWELCRRFNAHQGTKIQGKEPNGRIPKMLKELVSKAIGSLKEGQQKKSLDSPLLRKAISGANGSLSVCVFALPGEDREAYRLLVLVEQIGRCEEAAARQAKDIFGLTQREVQVMQHLLKGWSNKAIAYELKVAEQTVKEHLQRIMAKTKSSSRAGILCRVLLL